MRLLLDTNSAIWWLGRLPRLGPAALQEISSGRNDVFVSAISACEISIKTAIGKLDAPGDVEAQASAAGFTPLPVTLRHGVAMRDLPLHHRDPFDRILIAQARCEGLTVVTADRAFGAYDIPVLDARR